MTQTLNIQLNLRLIVYITFKNTKGVFTWNDFKYDFIPLFEIIRERLRVDRKVEYFTKVIQKMLRQLI
jgi:hypothetical protein